MTRTTRSFTTASALALFLVLSGITSATRAASISYGDFPAPPVLFEDVTESSETDPVPLYGPPEPFVTGLDFDPIGYAATGSNGSSDITNGQLNFMITSPIGVTDINLFEAGDYTIAGGPGTAATSVFAGAILRATVVGVNGLPVAPINLVPVNGSFGDSLPGNSIAQPWSLGLSLNVAGQLGPGQQATSIEVVINNSLVALSEAGTVSLIAKKEFVIDVEFVPEPATLAMATMALCGIGLIAARKRG